MRFGGEDVVRHKLVQRIVEAYDEYAAQQAPALREARRRSRPDRARARSTPRRSCARPAARGAGARPGVEDGHLAVALVDEERIRALNREHRGLDAPTDVLSFPIDEAGPAPGRASSATS